jgi:hypothetical protein
MQKRPAKKKLPRDVNARAFAIGELATGNAESNTESPKAEAGRKGGIKGGSARAQKLSAQRRAEIARAAARKRWQERPAAPKDEMD